MSVTCPVYDQINLTFMTGNCTLVDQTSWQGGVCARPAAVRQRMVVSVGFSHTDEGNARRVTDAQLTQQKHIQGEGVIKHVH